MANSERLHSFSHLVLFLMLFMVTLAVLKFSTPTGLAASNQSISSGGMGDLKPFITAVGLLMGLVIAAMFVVVHDFGRYPAKQASANAPQAKAQPAEHRSIEDINRALEDLRRKIGR